MERVTLRDEDLAAQLRNNLAMIYKRMGKFALAEQHYLASVEALEGLQGKDSEDVASLYNNLGGLYYAAGFPDQAKEVFLEALEMRTKLVGDEHPDVAQTLCNLGSVYYELGDNAAALALMGISAGALNIALFAGAVRVTAGDSGAPSPVVNRQVGLVAELTPSLTTTYHS